MCIHIADVLEKFTDEKGGFKSTLITDVQGLLGLYEASYLDTGGEKVLEEANEFSSKHLISCVENLEPNVARLVRHTSMHPCHMTISRYNARQYLENCQPRYGALEELAKIGLQSSSITTPERTQRDFKV